MVHFFILRKDEILPAKLYYAKSNASIVKVILQMFLLLAKQ